MSRLNKLWIGLLFGLLVPAIALLIFYFVKYSDLSLIEFISTFKKQGILTHIISLAVIPNLLVFFGFIQKNYLLSARGVLLSTFIFTLIVLIIRFT